jgi:hypothetical protein
MLFRLTLLVGTWNGYLELYFLQPQLLLDTIYCVVIMGSIDAETKLALLDNLSEFWIYASSKQTKGWQALAL